MFQTLPFQPLPSPQNLPLHLQIKISASRIAALFTHPPSTITHLLQLETDRSPSLVAIESATSELDDRNN